MYLFYFYFCKQLRGVPVTKAGDDEIDEEAEWIYKQAFSIPTISIQEGETPGSGHQPIAGRKNPSAVGKIREALKFIRNQNFEVCMRYLYFATMQSNFYLAF